MQLALPQVFLFEYLEQSFYRLCADFRYWEVGLIKSIPERQMQACREDMAMICKPDFDVETVLL